MSKRLKVKFIQSCCGIVLLLLSSFYLPTVSFASSVEVEKLSTTDLQRRYQVLIEELRCPKCQNQNLAGSDSPVAMDLRREVRRLLEEGLSDREIHDYLVARFGDFVLYRPPFQRNTLVLWLAPGLFAAVGLLVLILVVMRARGGSVATSAEVLTAEERISLQQLLRESEADTSRVSESKKHD